MDWPTPSRRSSASRRTQNLALVSAVVSGAVIATGLLLLVISRTDPAQGERVREVALDAVTPLWRVARAPFDALGSIGADAGHYLDAVDQNRTLRAERGRLATELERQRATLDENARLRALLRLRVPARRIVATARIAGASTGSYVRSAVLSAGRRDGVVPGQPVRAQAGLVGRIAESGNHAARVLLLTDPGSRVPVIIERTGQPALAVGTNTPLLQVRDRVGVETPLRPGDRLITSGDGGIFPPGVPVATVVRANVEPPLAKPSANPVGLGYVLVEKAYLPVPPVTAIPLSPNLAP